MLLPLGMRSRSFSLSWYVIRSNFIAQINRFSSTYPLLR